MSCAIVALAVCAASSARADEAAAREHFKRGIDLYDHKKFPEALVEFQAAYREKPSGGIKQNIALSYKGMNEPVKAANAFEEALDEGRTTLKPETREAIERELAELTRDKVATIRIAVVDSTAEPAKPLDGATIAVDGAPLAPDAARRPIHLAPGIHVFTAHRDGFADPPEKRLGLVVGAPVDATFQMGAKFGTLAIHPSVKDAVVRVDGQEVGRGDWTGKVSQGAHHLEIGAEGWKTTGVDVTVDAGATVDYPVTLYRPGEAPPPYEAPERPPSSQAKKAYVEVFGAYDATTYTLSPALAEPVGDGKKRSFSGASIGAKGGYRFSRYFAIELAAEVGGQSATYKIDDKDPDDTKSSITFWDVQPELRFTSPGRGRFTAGVGLFGVSGTKIDAKLAHPGTSRTQGSTVAFGSAILDAGAQLDAGPVFFEFLLFLHLHGVASVHDLAGERLMYESPGVRGGLRVGLGMPF